MPKVGLLVSYLMLTAASFAAVKYAGDWGVDDKLFYGAILTTASYGVLGTLLNSVSCRVGCGQTTMHLHKFFVSLVPCIALPFCVGQLWLKHNVYEDENAAFGLAGLGAFMAFLSLCCCLNQTVVDAMVFIETAALGGAGYKTDNHYITGAAICFACAHYLFSYCRRSCSSKMPPSDLYNYCLSGYIYCVLMANNSS